MMTALIDSSVDHSIADSLRRELLSDFAQACTEFAEARRQQRAKDTPAHRAAVLDSRARVDAVLDMYLMYLEIEHGSPDADDIDQGARLELPDAA
jgi:hypothetical protein